MTKYKVMDIKESSMFSAPIFLDDNYILLPPETPITNDLLNILKEWRYMEIQSDGEFMIAAEGLDLSATQGDISQIDQTFQAGEQFKKTLSFYFMLISFIEDVFREFILKSVLDSEAITAKIKELIDIVKNQPDIILGFTGMQHTIDNYIITHSINTTILALALGDFLKLPQHRLIELGLATFFHDIGMIKLPSHLYLNNKVLTPQEKKTIMTHTILGYRVLKNFNFSEKIALGALEHHERINGNGYPNRLKGDAISVYARIIAVTDAYEGQIRQRPHKKLKNAHTSMLELLRNENKNYDDTIVKSLVFCLSIYPIGSYVLLNNNAKGVVYKTNLMNPRFPTVKIVVDPQGNKVPDTELKLVQTSQENNVLITKSLDWEEAAKL